MKTNSIVVSGDYPTESAVGCKLIGPLNVRDRPEEENPRPAAGPVDHEAADAAAEDDGHDGEDATAADDIISPAPAIDTAEESIAAARAEEGTPAAATTEADGQRGSDPAPGDDTPGGNSDEGDAAAGDALALPPILNFGKGEVIPAGKYTLKVDRDRFEDYWFGSYLLEDYLVIEARLTDRGEYIACLNGKGQLLTDPVLLVHAERFKIPIKYRIYKDLTEAESRAFVLDSQDGSRLQTPKERRQLKHARVHAYLEIGVKSGNRLSFAEIGRRVGYTEARVRQIHREHQEPRDRNISDSKASEAPATASNSGAPPKKSKEKKIPATAPMAATAEPPARESAAIRTSRVTSRNTKSAQGPAALLDVGFDEDELVDTALDRCGIKQDEKSGWQSAGRQLLAEQRKNASGGHQDILKTAAQASVEYRAAADAAEAWLKQLLCTNAEGAA